MPLLIFFVKIERPIFEHVLRVTCAIGITYILLNLALQTNRTFNWQDFQECQEKSEQGADSRKMHEECGHHVNPAADSQYIFAFGFGWIPAAIYAGMWELLWRIKNRRLIRDIGNVYKGKWLSNIVILFMSLPFVIYFLLYLLSKYM